ncbi:tetratricopeptide repeat protein [bacterium]|nr:tetratricopeptide repeat protein [candidate division CSSED10-310 bacterium]
MKLVYVVFICVGLCMGCYPRRVGILENRADEITKSQGELKQKDLALTTQVEQLRKEVTTLAEQVRTLSAKMEIVSQGEAEGKPAVPGIGGNARPPVPGLTVPRELSAAGLLQSARGNMLSGNYNRAIIDLEELITLYPDSDAAEESRYLVGESYFAQGDYFRAVESFSAFLTRHPDSTRLAAAALKTADACSALGWNDKAKALYNELVSNHKDTDEAKIAEGRLAELAHTRQ